MSGPYIPKDAPTVHTCRLFLVGEGQLIREVISRKQAQERGLKRYFTGKPCKHGHIDERYTSSRACCECSDTSAKEWKKDNPEKIAEYLRQYNKENPHVYRASVSKRRAARLNATLPGHDEELKQIYANCPDGYHVDHIVPLQGKEVCGLHVPWNLQYLPAEENIRKSNRLIEPEAVNDHLKVAV